MFAIEDDPVWLYAAWEFAFEDDERDNQEYSDDASNLLAGRFSLADARGNLPVFLRCTILEYIDRSLSRRPKCLRIANAATLAAITSQRLLSSLCATLLVWAIFPILE